MHAVQWNGKVVVQIVCCSRHLNEGQRSRSKWAAVTVGRFLWQKAFVLRHYNDPWIGRWDFCDTTETIIQYLETCLSMDGLIFLGWDQQIYCLSIPVLMIHHTAIVTYRIEWIANFDAPKEHICMHNCILYNQALGQSSTFINAAMMSRQPIGYGSWFFMPKPNGPTDTEQLSMLRNRPTLSPLPGLLWLKFPKCLDEPKGAPKRTCGTQQPGMGVFRRCNLRVLSIPNWITLLLPKSVFRKLESERGHT